MVGVVDDLEKCVVRLPLQPPPRVVQVGLEEPFDGRIHYVGDVEQSARIAALAL